MTGLRKWAEDQPLPTRLHWTAEYFRWCGMSSALFLGAYLVITPFSSALRADFATHPSRYALVILLSALTAASWWWTGERLHPRQRDGAWMAIASLAIPLFGLTRGGPGIGTLVVSALGLLAILTSWRELD
jgi:hypothetical protein